jgi:hypothetical protein
MKPIERLGEYPRVAAVASYNINSSYKYFHLLIRVTQYINLQNSCLLGMAPQATVALVEPFS